MKNILFRKVYKELLNESIIDQGSFLEKLVNVINKKPSVEGRYGKLIKKIVLSAKKTNLLDLKREQGKIEDTLRKTDTTPEEKVLLKKRKSANKKARKKAEIIIHKALQSIKGLDGEPINLKLIRPLYDSIIRYLEEKGDASIDDCIKSADYYMKDFYNNASEKEKEVIDKGKFDFSIIFKRTNFYQDFIDFKSSILNLSSDLVDVYEDERVKIVYPASSEVFNSYINDNSMPLNWCTQTKATWHDYTRTQLVMIMQEKVSNQQQHYGFDTSIISLKVSHNGLVDHHGTCDAKNDHMDFKSVDSLLSKEAYEEIKLKSLSIKENYIETSPTSLLAKDLGNQIDGLLDINNYKEIENVLYSIANNIRGSWNFSAKHLISTAIDKNKIDKVIDMYAEFIAGMPDNDDYGEGIDWSGPLFARRDKPQKIHFALKLLEKALNKRSHEKYLISLVSLFTRDIHDWLRESGDVNKNLKKAIINAANTNNPANFRKVINVCLNNSYIKNNILTQDFVEIFSTKGFQEFLIANKGSIVQSSLAREAVNVYSPENAYQWLEDLILNNKEQFSVKFQKIKDNAEKNIVNLENKLKSLDNKDNIGSIKNKIKKYRILTNLKLEDIDNNTIVNFILKFSSTGSTVGISNVDAEKYLLSHKTSGIDLSSYIKNMLSDVVMFERLYNVNNKLSSIILDIFLKYDESGIVEYSEKSYEVFNKAINITDQREINRLVDNLVVLGGGSLGSLKKVIYVLNIKFKKSQESINKKLMHTITKLFINIAENSLSNFRGYETQLDYFNKNFDFFKYLINKSGDGYFTPEQIKLSLSMWIKSNIYENRYLSSSSNNLVNLFIKNLMSIPEIKSNIVSIKDNMQNNSFERYYVMFYLFEINEIDISQFNDAFIEYVNMIAKGDPKIDVLPVYSSRYEGAHTTLENLNKVLVKHFTITSKSTSILGMFVEKDLFFSNKRYAYRDLVVRAIIKSNNLNIAFDKEILKNIIMSNKFKEDNYSFRKDKKLIYNNFIKVSSDDGTNNLSMKDRAIVRDTLVYGLRKGKKHLRNDYNFILELVRELDNISRRHMYLAFPDEEDLNKIDLDEALLKLYLRLLIS